MIHLRLVVPVYNEHSNIEPFTRAVQEMVTHLPQIEGSLLFVNDCSTDDTLIQINKQQCLNLRVLVVTLPKRGGHQAALEYGLLHKVSPADIYVTLDGDLQHPISTIPDLVGKYEEGFEIVHCIRTQFNHTLRARCGRFFSSVIRLVSGNILLKDSSDFRLMTANAVQAYFSVLPKKRILRLTTLQLPVKQTHIYYEQKLRYSGKPSYTFLQSSGLALKICCNIPKRTMFWLCVWFSLTFLGGYVFTFS